MIASNVLAILAGTKTETRRLIRDAKPAAGLKPSLITRSITPGTWRIISTDGKEKSGTVQQTVLKSPYGYRGDVLWMQENYCVQGYNMTPNDQVILSGYYPADGKAFRVSLTEDESKLFLARKSHSGFSPARFMYRSLSRLDLRITDISPQFLHSITEASAWAEGITGAAPGNLNRPLDCLAGLCLQFPDLDLASMAKDDPSLFHYAKSGTDAGKVIQTTARGVYAALWEGIHGPGTWAENPPVWAISFSVSQRH